MARVSLSWMSVLGAAVTLGAACDPLRTDDYEGEALLTLHGQVRSALETTPDVEIALAYLNATNADDGGVVYHWSIVAAEAHGEFPAQFTIEVHEPPPAGAMINLPLFEDRDGDWVADELEAPAGHDPDVAELSMGFAFVFAVESLEKLANAIAPVNSSLDEGLYQYLATHRAELGVVAAAPVTVYYTQTTLSPEEWASTYQDHGPTFTPGFHVVMNDIDLQNAMLDRVECTQQHANVIAPCFRGCASGDVACYEACELPSCGPEYRTNVSQVIDAETTVIELALGEPDLIDAENRLATLEWDDHCADSSNPCFGYGDGVCQTAADGCLLTDPDCASPAEDRCTERAEDDEL